MADISPETYRAMPQEERSRLRAAWRALAGKAEPGQQATTPNGAPFPLRSWPPDAAVDIQHLAEWADGRINATAATAADHVYPSGSLPSGDNTLKGGAANVQGGITYASASGLFTVPTTGFYLVTVHAQVTAASTGWVLNVSRSSDTARPGTTMLQNGSALYGSMAANSGWLAAGGTISVHLIAYSAAVTLGENRVNIIRLH